MPRQFLWLDSIKSWPDSNSKQLQVTLNWRAWKTSDSTNMTWPQIWSIMPACLPILLLFTSCSPFVLLYVNRTAFEMLVFCWPFSSNISLDRFLAGCVLFFLFVIYLKQRQYFTNYLGCCLWWSYCKTDLRNWPSKSYVIWSSYITWADEE